ncbi:LysR family transcriptional regulator [Vibrio maerlii]|uniref:LysR family transcriptional regulator n=1 Tax=Vibrio maerlii TaxID=2231648 RepID=UPI0013E05A0A|nr:LysR family transcriptional regulator [Vibrio maerlii]
MFKYFIAVIEEKGVSNAAKALGVTPSAVSQNISKLNDFYNDVLFTRSGVTLVPTTNGLNLYHAVKPAVEELSTQANALKNPAKAKRTISFLSHKDVDLLFYTQLLNRITESQFDISLVNISSGNNEELWIDDLVQRKADFIISTQPIHFQGYENQLLLREEIVSVCSGDNPQGHKLDDEEGFFDLDYIAYTTRRNRQRMFSALLQDRKDTRNIVYQCDSMLTSLYMVSNSDLVCMALRHHASQFKDSLSLSLHPLPFTEKAEIPIFLSHRKVSNNDTTLKWILNQVKDIFAHYKYE